MRTARWKRLGSCLAVWALAGGAAAADFSVDDLRDEVDANPGDGLCATASGTCTLRAAVQESNASPGADRIALGAGNYNLDLGITGPDPVAGEDVAARGDLDILDSVTIEGEGAATTIIDGNFKDRIFDIIQAEATISGLTLTHGQVSYSATACGGALISDGTLTVRDAVLVENHAGKSVSANTPPTDDAFKTENDGGALCNLGGTLTLDNVTFTGNTATQDGGALANVGGVVSATNITATGNMALRNGGAIANGDIDGGYTLASLETGTLTLSDSTLSENRTGVFGGDFHHHGGAVVSFGTLDIQKTGIKTNRSGFGGGIFVATGSGTLSDTTIEGNFSRFNGGGINIGGHLDRDHIALPPIDFTITNSRIAGNSLTDGLADTPGPHGGGIFVSDLSQVTITGSEIADNDARAECLICQESDGGGIYNNSGELTLTDVRLKGNTAARSGGGLYNRSDQVVTISRSLIENNQARANGGGVSGENSTDPAGAPTLAIETSLVTGNSATRGGAIAGSLRLTNSTLSGNRADDVGGAVYVRLPAAETQTVRADLLHVTIADNEAANGAAAIDNRNNGVVNLTQSVVSSPADASNCAGTINSGDYNIVNDATCGTAAEHDQVADPLLETLADNGGPTLTHALAVTSPAVGLIPKTNCPAQDQRLFERAAETCDSGAFETDADPAAPGSGGEPITPVRSNGGGGGGSTGFELLALLLASSIFGKRILKTAHRR